MFLSLLNLNSFTSCPALPRFVNLHPSQPSLVILLFYPVLPTPVPLNSLLPTLHPPTPSRHVLNCPSPSHPVPPRPASPLSTPSCMTSTMPHPASVCHTQPHPVPPQPVIMSCPASPRPRLPYHSFLVSSTSSHFPLILPRFSVTLLQHFLTLFNSLRFPDLFYVLTKSVPPLFIMLRGVQTGLADGGCCYWRGMDGRRVAGHVGAGDVVHSRRHTPV